MFAKILEDRRSGRRWVEIELPHSVDDENDLDLVAYIRKFIDAVERERQRADQEIETLERLYRSDEGAAEAE
jgi:hypothetical protein